MHFVCRVSLLLPIAILPWLFGGVHVGAQYALAAAVLAGLMFWIFQYRGESRPLPVAILPLLFAVLLGIFHLLPLGPTVLASVSPRAEAAWSQWSSNDSSASRIDEALFRQDVGEFADAAPATASLYPASTRHDLAFLFLALAMFFLGAQLFCRAASQKLLWGIVAANGALFAFFGLAQQLVWSGRLYGHVALEGGGSPFAAFVNRNNAAGYLNLCLAAAIGFALCCFATKGDRLSPSRATIARHAGPRFGRFRMVWESCLHAVGRLDGAKLLSLLAIIVIVSGILCALSRGGWISMAFATAVVVTVLAKARRVRYTAWTSLLVVVACLALVEWLGHREAIGNRWQSLHNDAVSLDNGRIRHWPDGLRAGSDFWLTGTGLGTYRYAYRPYVQSAERGVWFFHAENQYVEAFVEGGVVGLGLLLAAIGLLALACRRLLQDPRDSASYICGIVGTFALTSQAIHGGFDFGLYLPANMALFALMCGSVAGRAARLERLSTRDCSERAFTPPIGFHARPVALPALATVLFCASLSGVVEIRKSSAADSALRASRIPDSPGDASIGETSQQISQLGRAIGQRSDDAEAHLAMARLLIQRYRLQAFQALRQQTLPEQTDARLWTMTSPIVLHDAVQRYEQEGRTIELENLRRSETVQADLKHAARHLLLANRSCPMLPDAYLLLAEIGPVVSPIDIDSVMLRRTRHLAGGNFELLRECGFAELQAGRTANGLADIRRSAELEPDQIGAVLQLASAWIDARSLVNEALPASPYLLVKLAREHFSGQDGTQMRIALLQRAATLADAEAMEPAERLQFEATIFELQDRNQLAVERRSLAVKKRPEMTEWRYELALLLQRQGDVELAWEHARTCVRMDPDNERFDALLRELVRARLASR